MNDARDGPRRVGARAGLPALIAALAVYALLLALMALPLDLEAYRDVFSERGPFERLSVPLWLLVVAACVGVAWRRPRAVALRLLTLGAVAGFLAMREADWHYALAGGNVLRVKFYLHNPATLEVKVVAGVVVAIALALLFRTLFLGVQLLRRRATWKLAWTRTLLLGIAVGIGTKLLDRAISLSGEWFGLVFDERTGRLIGAWEEGFECILPLIFCYALYQFRLARPAIAVAATTPAATRSAPPPAQA